ncbi:uncharacterized protein LOC131604957 [Vicia villosa]|uniref:uncharacterized protein LOC131604957 n=1 Tax=Vicia villosa TaxID=3911 RepID=UPI00273A9025|nr:uncharacterized protein LOC131604957 [Vicia villosa]
MPSSSDEERPKTTDLSSKLDDPSLNPRNPYYLHPGENPGATIVAPPLDDNNYHNWSKSMRRSSKNKLSFINGALPRPSPTNPDFELWDRANSMVISWINRTLSPHIAKSTIFFNSAHDLWEDLRERFTKGNHFRFSNLLRDLHSIQQGDRSLSTYFTGLKILWDELDDSRPSPSCSCSVPCTCDLAKAVRTYKHMEYVTFFLKASSLTPTVLAANSNSKPKGKPSSKTPILCTKCSKTNHTIENCYFKHGFPPGYRSKNSTTIADSNTLITSDTEFSLSKLDYQHLLLLLQQSKKDNPNPKPSNSDVAVISGIAPTAKQTKLPFPTSNSTTTKCFDLVEG